MAAVEDPAYIRGRREILEKHGLQVFAISNHLTGQAVCDDPIDERHRGILSARVWGDGEPEGVRQRAAEAMQVTARAAATLGVPTVVRFTGSKIWKTVAMFPPVPESMVDDGYRDFADRWNPILDVFDEVGVRFAHEVHPSEIAYDYWTAVRALEAVGRREAFGLNWDPSHFVWQDLDPVGFLWENVTSGAAERAAPRTVTFASQFVPTRGKHSPGKLIKSECFSGCCRSGSGGCEVGHPRSAQEGVA